MEKYPVTKGEVAFVKTTDEAVFVLNVDDELALVTRAVHTADTGVNYVEDSFPVNQLQTDKQRLLKEMDFIRFSADTRDKASTEYEAAKKQGKSAIAVAIPQADGNGGGYSN